MPAALKSVAVLVMFLAVCYGAAALGGYFTNMGTREWYATLNRPDWTPSGQIIGMVWTILFAMMAVAAWLVWRRAGFTNAGPAMTLFAIQLLLNVLWSVVFFGLRQPGWAFAELILLQAFIIATLVAFWRITPAAGALFIPYAAWVAFAGMLNFLIWRLNV